jgi:hypothetical protein
MRAWVFISAAAAVVAGCSYSDNSGNAAAKAGTEASYGSGGATQANAQWTSFVQSFLDGWFKLDPAFAVYQGKHEFDGQLPDWSNAGLTRQADYLKVAVTKAQGFKDASLTPQQRFERDYLIKVAEGKLFWLTDADQPHSNPAYYVGGGLDPNVYLARPYADLPTRMKAVIALFDNVPTAAANIRANLKTPMPASFIDYGVAAFNGFADFYAHDAGQAFTGVKDAALQKQFADASAKASKAMRDIATWLQSQRGSATTNFALGGDRFSRMLKATEDVDVPLDQLEAIGKADLAKNQAALKAACAQYAPGATIEACMTKMQNDKPPEGPVEAARRQIPMLKQFVLAHDIVSIPGTEEAKVEEAPPYNRQNSAYIDPPGPFDKGIPSVYYIAPPDPSWPKAEQDAFVPGKDDLLFTTVHEVMPGHFVQFLHANRSPSIFGQLFVGYAYAEGWAHYAEQMMWDAGLGNGEPETHIGQLSNALLRDCRFLSAIGMHAHGMTQAQSEEMFRTQCFQDPGNAKQQAARGTYDPAYLNYTLGKLMIMKLRADWTATRGGRKAWKAFHNQFLSYGGPPIPLVRQAMMNEPQAKAVF